MTRKKIRPKSLSSLGRFGERFQCGKIRDHRGDLLLCCREECTGDSHCEHCERYPMRLDK
jgi:hypothetical protein